MCLNIFHATVEKSKLLALLEIRLALHDPQYTMQVFLFPSLSKHLRNALLLAAKSHNITSFLMYVTW